MNESKAVKHSGIAGFATLCAVVVLVLGLLFIGGFLPGRTVFSNDGPLGAISARATQLPSGYFGYWQDLNWLGVPGPSAPPDITQVVTTVVGKLWFSKIYAPFSLLFVGATAFFCFRQWRFTPIACVLGGIAAALNSDFFSTACWGVVTQPIAFGLSFLAIGLLADDESPRRWIKVILAGFAVGMGVMEAFDIGAIFSLFVAAFVVYQTLTEPGPLARRIARGAGRLGVVAIFAGFIASAALITLVGTQIKGIAGIDTGGETKEEGWNWATQWSLPKREILDVLLPGIYGFRMNTLEGDQYWGAGGRDPAWDRYFASGKQGPPPGGALRFSGGGHYAGALVLVAAAWALAQSFRKRDSLLSTREKQFVWFWGAVLVVSVLLAFGRFAPFYQFFYALPYASTIRNPAKFIHVFEWALVIVAAYGLNCLARQYLRAESAPAGAALSFKSWWAKATVFERKWIKACAIFLGAFLVGWLIYISSSDRLVSYLQEVGFDPGAAAEVARFSIRQPGWTALFLGLSFVLFALTIKGVFTAKRSTAAGVLLGLLLVVDLARANAPWVVTYNWKDKLATNPVVDFLRQAPHEYRVALVPLERMIDFSKLPPEARSLADLYLQLHSLYHIEWMQHHFPFYNIQSLEVVQMSRMPADYKAYLAALGGVPLRYWQLTNTRYLVAPAAILELLNQRDPQRRFRLAMAFDIAPKPGVTQVRTYEDLTAVANTNGSFAVIEFTGALPRANLYGTWQVSTNDQATLQTLASPLFDPAQSVLVAPAIQPPASTNQPAGKVEIVSYAPKQIRLKTKSESSSVLLYNDKYDANWHAILDDKPAELLRCNFIVRGVQVPPGEHSVELRYQPSLTGLYVSLAAIVAGIGLLGFLVVSGRVRRRGEQEPAPAR